MQRSRGFAVLMGLCSASLASCSDATTYSVPIGAAGYISGLPVYALPRGYIVLNAKRDSSGLTLSWETKLVADNDARFDLAWVENEFATDHFVFQIGSNGLLNAVNSENTDQTPAIVAKVIQIVEAAAFGILSFWCGS